MKFILTTFALATVFQLTAQNSEDLIPKEAVSVFSINNINLLQKISLDDLVKYEFMEEVQQELFDGSTSGKTIKDSGIDFDQKMNIFTGHSEEFKVTGMSFGLENREDFFTVFDDFQPIESPYEGVDFFASYFNRIAIRGNTGILFRIEPHMGLVDDITDSIWYARGNGYPWESRSYNWMEDINWEEETWEEEAVWEEVEVIEDIEIAPPPIEDEPRENIEAVPPPPPPMEEETWEIEAPEEQTEKEPVHEEKTYYELRDSVELALQETYMNQFCESLLVKGENLIQNAPALKAKLAKATEGTFYMDNERNMRAQMYRNMMLPFYNPFYQRINELYSGNIILGDLTIGESSIELHIDTKYGEQLGGIYENLADAKFDKNVLKYIHENNKSFFTYNINMRAAYEEMMNVMIPMLRDSENDGLATAGLFYDIMNEFLDKDAIFDAYKGSMFGTYNGIQKIKTKKIIFDYDEETFEYTEQEVEAEEDMPIFTVGFSTERNDIAEKILRHMERVTHFVHNEGNYWVADDAVLRTAPLYMINKNGLFIFTNDETLAKFNSNGYGSSAMSKRKAKKAKKGGMMYAYADLSSALEELPKDIFSDRENELIDVFRGKTGTVELTSTKSTKKGTSVTLTYTYEGDYENSGTYILDLINSLYVYSK